MVSPIKPTNYLLLLLGVSACAGGIVSDPKAQSRSLQGARLPAPADLGEEKEEVTMVENGVSRTTIKFKRESQLRLGAASELGLTEKSITVPAGRLATVISRVTMANNKEYLYVALHNPLSITEKSGPSLSGASLKISEGYVTTVDVEVVPEETITPETGKGPTTPSTTPTSPDLSQASCSVALDLGSSGKTSKRVQAGTQMLSGQVFRTDAMEASSVVVTLDGLNKSDISSVKFQLELDAVTQGAAKLSPSSELCEIPKVTVDASVKPDASATSKAQAAAALSREFAKTGFNTCKKMPEFALASDKFTASEVNTIKASLKDLKTTPNNWMGVRLNVNAKVLVSSTEIICKPSQLQLMSPLVMDFSGKETIETVSVLQSKVRFDLLGDGRNVRTGWISGKNQALLALDLNGNGKVDNGRELFGEATLLSDKNPAQNGFIALAQYDLNKDGVINTKDKVFDKLILWFDQNQDGVTNKGELKTLSALGVTGIDVRYKKSNQANDNSILENNVALEARFNGPSACGTAGCKIYDVYFSTMSDESLAKK